MSTPTTQQGLPGVTAKTPGVYTAHDMEKVQQVLAWLDQHKQSRAWLAKKANLPGGTVSQVLSGKYPSSPTKQLNQIIATLDVESERARDGTPGYVVGSVHKLVSVVCERTRKHQSLGVVTAYSGVGKTRTLKEYSERHPMTLFIEVEPNMQPGVLMVDLLTQLNNAIPAGLSLKLRELIRVLKGTNFLIIVDEAENMSGQALEYLRRIRDKAEVGVVLAGTEKLMTLVKPQHGQFDQVRNRVSMWPETIQRITRDDADDMVRVALAGLPGLAELPDDVLDTLWAYCDGNARVLNEALIPAVKDYGVGKALTPGLVEQIAAKVLFMAKPRVEGGK